MLVHGGNHDVKYKIKIFVIVYIIGGGNVKDTIGYTVPQKHFMNSLLFDQLMHQIDVLISSKQKEWEDKLQVLRTQLQCRERDLSSLRVTVQEKEAQVQVPRVLNLDFSFRTGY